MSEFPAVFQWNRLAMCFGVRAEDRADGIAENQGLSHQLERVQWSSLARHCKTIIMLSFWL